MAQRLFLSSWCRELIGAAFQELSNGIHVIKIHRDIGELKLIAVTSTVEDYVC